MTRFKLSKAAHIARISPLSGGRWLVSTAAAPNSAIALVWVDPAAGPTRREDVKAGHAVTSADGRRIAVDRWRPTVGRQLHLAGADESIAHWVPPPPARPGEELRWEAPFGFDTDGRVMMVRRWSRPPGDHYRNELVCMPEAGGAGEQRAEWDGLPLLVAASADGRRAAVADHLIPSDVFGFGPGGVQLRWRFTPPKVQTAALAFAPDGSRLAVLAGRKGYLLDADTGEVAATLTGMPKPPAAVAFTPDGRRLLTGGADGVIRAWDAATGRPGTVWDFRVGPVTAVALSIDGLTAAAAGTQGRLVVWDLDA